MANIHTPIPELQLNDGNSMPMIAYGTGTAWSKGRRPGSQVDRALVESIKLALGMGYRHIDCAESYGNETEVGIAIKESKIPRSDLYITTKVMDGTDDIEAALRASLKKLQLDHVDLYLLHSPYFAYEGAAKADPAAALRSAWATMASLRAAGLAASVGVSNFLPEHLAAMLDGGDGEEPTPAVNQVELHGYLPRAALVADCRARGVAVAAYGALAPVTSGSPGPLDATLAALARKYAVTPSEVCLRWAIDQRIAVVTTSGKEQRLSDYLRATKFKLTPAEVKEISEKGAEKHYRRFWAGKFAADNRL